MKESRGVEGMEENKWKSRVSASNPSGRDLLVQRVRGKRIRDKQNRGESE